MSKPFLLEPEKNIVVVSGPAGSGKDTLIDRALEDLPFQKIITSTSRAKRSSERDGVEYYFLTKEVFEKRILEGAFIEYSQNENGAYYGIEKIHFEDAFKQNKKVIWKVDWKGMLSVKKLFPTLQSICIIAPEETLNTRIRSREGAEYTEQYFQERAQYAKDYFTHLEDYDYVIWNEDGKLESSVEKFKELLVTITGA